MVGEIIVPSLGESVYEANITKWFKNVGDSVKLDEPLVELETDKIAFDINSPADGVLKEIKFSEGKTVEVSTLIGLIEVGATGIDTKSAKIIKSASAPKVESKIESIQAKKQYPSLVGFFLENIDLLYTLCKKHKISHHDIDEKKPTIQSKIITDNLPLNICNIEHYRYHLEFFLRMLDIYYAHKPVIAGLYMNNLVQSISGKKDISVVKIKIEKFLNTVIEKKFRMYGLLDKYMDTIISIHEHYIPTNSQIKTKNNGIEFENSTALAFEKLGFLVTKTVQTGDFGADLIASRDAVKICIQCKDHASTIGIKAVQEVVSAKVHYKCTHAMVVANSSFSDAAELLAAGNQVILVNNIAFLENTLSIALGHE